MSGILARCASKNGIYGHTKCIQQNMDSKGIVGYVEGQPNHHLDTLGADLKNISGGAKLGFLSSVTLFPSVGG